MLSRPNLLQRAKPELRQAIDELKKLYPSTAAMIEKHLEETYFFIDLRYGVVLEIENALFGYEEHRNKKVYNLFENLQ